MHSTGPQTYPFLKGPGTGGQTRGQNYIYSGPGRGLGGSQPQGGVGNPGGKKYIVAGDVGVTNYIFFGGRARAFGADPPDFSTWPEKC